MVQFRIEVIVDPASAVRGTQQVERQLNRTENAADRLRQTIARALVFVGVGAAIRQLVLLADTFTNIQNRLRTVTAGTEELNQATQQLFAISNRTRSSFEATAEVYARVGLAARDLGVSQQQLLEFTESLNQAVILSGASAQEAQAGLIQLSQGLASGALRGDELRSVLEQLPVVADVIAQSLNVTRGELRELGSEGRISADIVLTAFAEAREELEGRFARSVPTIGQAFTRLNNNLIQLIGAFNEATGVAAGVSEALIFLADNLESLIQSTLIAAGVLGATFAATVLPAVIAGIRNLIASLIALRTAFFALQIPIAGQIVALAALVAGVGAYSTGLVGARRETQQFIDDQRSLAMALDSTDRSVSDFIDELARLSQAERDLQLLRLPLIIDTLEEDINNLVTEVDEIVTRGLDNLVIQLTGQRILPELEDIAAQFERDLDPARLIRGLRDALGQLDDETADLAFVSVLRELSELPNFDNIDVLVSRLERARQVFDAATPGAIATSQAVQAVGDAFSGAAEAVEDTFAGTIDSINVLARAAIELQRAQFIEDGDIRRLRELENAIDLAELRTETFNDVLEETESRLLANAAAVAVVTSATAALARAQRDAEDAFTEQVESLERELTLRGLVATEQTAAAEALERESAAIDLRNRLTADAIETFGELSDAQRQVIEDLVVLQDQTLAAEQAQRQLNAARADPAFSDVLANLERENTLLQLNRRDREVLSAVLRAQQTLRRDLALEERAAIGRLVEENQAIRDQIVLQRALSDIERQRALLGVGPTEREILGPLLNLEGRLGRALTEDEREDVAERLRANQALADQRAILDQLAGPLETYRRGIAAINSIQADTAGGQERLNALARDLRITYLDTATDVGAGFERGFLRAERSLEDFASSSERLITDAFSSAQDVLVEFFQTGELNAQRFFAVLSENFLRLGTQQLFAGAFGEQGLNIGGLFGEGGFDLGSLFDFGGLLGFQRGVQNAPVDSLSVASIGGVDNRLVAFRARSDETVSVNRPGESGQRPIQIIQNISTPDVEGFRRSEGQILARTQAALQRANQRNN